MSRTCFPSSSLWGSRIILSLWALNCLTPLGAVQKPKDWVGDTPPPRSAARGWLNCCDQTPSRSLGQAPVQDPSARPQRPLSTRFPTPGSPLVPRFALTEPGSRVCAAGWGGSGSTAGAGVPPGDAAMAHSCSAGGRDPRVFSSAGRAAPRLSGRGEGRTRGGRPRRPATRGKSGSCEVHGFVSPKGKIPKAHILWGKGQVSPWGPCSLRRVREGMRTRGG